MEAVAEHISFEAIARKDSEEMARQRAKILAAVCENIDRSDEMADFVSDPEKRRLAHESAKIYLENFLATVGYQLPGALLEYQDWLRGFLSARDFPALFLPRMIRAVRHAVHAFLEGHDSDAIGSVLRQLQDRETRLGGETA